MVHLATYRLIEHKCQEWSVKIWLATIDFMKAFDSISYNSMWNALKTFGIEQNYISLLKRLIKDQKATVLTDKESDMFEIKRETNQGDPLSSLLLKMIFQVGRSKKEWAYAWETTSQIASQIYDLLTMCSCLQLHWSSYRK